MILYRHDDFKHAVTHPGLRGVTIDTFWQRNGTIELSITTLGTVIALRSLTRRIFTSFTFDSQFVVMHLQLHIILGQAGQIDADHHLIATLRNLDSWGPVARGDPAMSLPDLADGLLQDFAKELIHLLGHFSHHDERLFPHVQHGR